MTSDPAPSRRSLLRVSTAVTGTACALALAGCSGPAPGPGSGGTPSAIPTTGTPVKVGTLAQLPVGSGASVTANAVPLVLYRPDEKTVLAYSAVCTHAGCTVAPQAATFVCPCHGSTFSGADGSVTAGPARRALPRFAVTIEGDAILVRI